MFSQMITSPSLNDKINHMTLIAKIKKTEDKTNVRNHLFALLLQLFFHSNYTHLFFINFIWNYCVVLSKLYTSLLFWGDIMEFALIYFFLFFCFEKEVLCDIHIFTFLIN